MAKRDGFFGTIILSRYSSQQYAFIACSIRSSAQTDEIYALYNGRRMNLPPIRLKKKLGSSESNAALLLSSLLMGSQYEIQSRRTILSLWLLPYCISSDC